MTDPTPDVPTLRRLLAEATPGPWRLSPNEGGVTDVLSGSGIGMPYTVLTADDHDGALIVAAVNALPGILDRLEAAEGAVARCAELADDWAKEGPSLVRNAYDGSNVTEGLTLERLPCRLRAALAEVTP